MANSDVDLISSLEKPWLGTLIDSHGRSGSTTVRKPKAAKQADSSAIHHFSIEHIMTGQRSAFANASRRGLEAYHCGFKSGFFHIGKPVA